MEYYEIRLWWIPQYCLLRNLKLMLMFVNLFGANIFNIYAYIEQKDIILIIIHIYLTYYKVIIN